MAKLQVPIVVTKWELPMEIIFDMSGFPNFAPGFSEIGIYFLFFLLCSFFGGERNCFLFFGSLLSVHTFLPYAAASPSANFIWQLQAKCPFLIIWLIKKIRNYAFSNFFWKMQMPVKGIISTKNYVMASDRMPSRYFEVLKSWLHLIHTENQSPKCVHFLFFKKDKLVPHKQRTPFGSRFSLFCTDLLNQPVLTWICGNYSPFDISVPRTE